MQIFPIVMFMAAVAITPVVILTTCWKELANLWKGRLRGYDSICDAASGPVTSNTSGSVHGALLMALKRVTPVLIARDVKVDIAVVPGLYVNTGGLILADLMEELLTQVIHRAPVSHVLITAVDRGGQVCVAMSDDAAGATAAERSASVEALAVRLAAHGATLNVNVRPAEGTTVTLHMPAAPAVLVATSRIAGVAEASDDLAREPLSDIGFPNGHHLADRYVCSRVS